DQVTEHTLDEKRSNHRDGDVAFGVFGLTTHSSYRFESDKNQYGDRRLHKHPSEVMDADHGSSRRMRHEIPFFVMLRISDREGNRLAIRVQQRLWIAHRIPRDHVGLLSVHCLLLCGKLVRKRASSLSIVVQSDASRWVIHAITQGHYRKHQKCTD